jgi:hypothetical protein
MKFKAKIVGWGVLVLAGIAVLGYVVMLLWNAIMPAVFSGIHTLEYRQALGLMILTRILFGGFRGRGGVRGRRWERLENLSPEERARLRRGCGPESNTEGTS